MSATSAEGAERAIALLTEMVRIPSLSGSEEPLARWLVQEMRALGYDAERDEAGNAVGHLGSGPRHIVLLGHLDTVPGVVPVRREGALLFGRGSVDAKGPLAAMVMAVAGLGPQPGTRITVAGAVEEEAASSRGARHVAGLFAPDYAIIGEPSGWDRVTLGYKGRLLIDYCLVRPMAHTAGKAHAAVEEAVSVWLRVAAEAGGYNAARVSPFGRVDASLRALNTSSDGLEDRVTMTIGLRLPLDFEPDALLERLAGWAGDATVTTRGHESAYLADRRNALTSAFLAAIRAEGSRATFVTKTGTSDMNVLGPLWKCPIIAYGPGDSAWDHTPDEHIDLDEYLRGIAVLRGALARLAAAGSRA